MCLYSVWLLLKKVPSASHTLRQGNAIIGSMKKIIKIIVLILIILVTLLIISFRSNIGFPIEHPIYASCFGIKKERIDNSGIKRISCYGFIYDYWLE